MIKTVVLSRNMETPVSELDGLHAIIRNFSTGTIYVSTTMNFTIGGNNVKTIPPLTADILRDIVDSTVYIISPDNDAAHVECEGTHFLNQNFATTLATDGVSTESYIHPTQDGNTLTKYHPLLTDDEPDGKGHDIVSPADGFTVEMSSGTANVDGEVIITLGNDKPSGEEGNKQGKIDIYGAGTGRTRIIAPNTSENVEIELPSKSGQLVSREEFTHYKSIVDADIPDEEITTLVEEIGDIDYDFEGDSSAPVGGVSKEYVDAQDEYVLREAKAYADAQDETILKEAKDYAEEYTDASQQAEADKEAEEEAANDITASDISELVYGTSTDPGDITNTDIVDLVNEPFDDSE